MEQLDPVAKTKAKLKELKKQIISKQKAIDALQDEIYELQDKKDEAEQYLTIHEYFAKVTHVLEKSRYYEIQMINRDTATRGIMSDLRKGKHDADGLFYVKDTRIDYYILDKEYVVLYPPNLKIPNIGTRGCITATEFKTSYKDLQDQELSDTIVTIKNGWKVKLLLKPFAFNAQTFYDMDYRKEWNNGDLVYEGNNYGDTTKFYIVGKVISKNQYDW